MGTKEFLSHLDSRTAGPS